MTSVVKVEVEHRTESRPLKWCQSTSSVMSSKPRLVVRVSPLADADHIRPATYLLVEPSQRVANSLGPVALVVEADADPAAVG